MSDDLQDLKKYIDRCVENNSKDSNIYKMALLAQERLSDIIKTAPVEDQTEEESEQAA